MDKLKHSINVTTDFGKVVFPINCFRYVCMRKADALTDKNENETFHFEITQPFQSDAMLSNDLM
jgi:hypothetical protein